ncbi:tail fiber domain-containing protein, partial [Luminiphilus sp.]|nr:tail fiber domain-containing protein [Luminiphilus sp.]
ASGYGALSSNSTGGYNTAIGRSALSSNTTGLENTASGYGALSSNSTGGYNTASGSDALLRNTTGDFNTASGSQALYSNTTGSFNTASSRIALYSNTTGSYNTAVGYYADVEIGNLQNATAIGYNAKVDASNKVRIGNTAVTVIQGQVAFTSSSDARLKDRITSVSDGLALINDLNPVSYHRTNNPESDIEMGLLAQEVEATLEKHGLGNSGMVHQPTEDAYMSLRYNDLLAPMIKAIQELDDASMAKDEQIALLEQKLETQQEELLAIVQSQQEQIAQLQRMVEQQFAMN